MELTVRFELTRRLSPNRITKPGHSTTVLSQQVYLRKERMAIKEPSVGARQKKGHEVLWVWQPMERVMVVETTSSGWRPDALAVVLHPHIKGDGG